MKRKFQALIKTVVPNRWHRQFRVAFSFYYFGVNFECPFCGGHFRRLLPVGRERRALNNARVVGGGYRLNARCPRCSSIDRERLVYLYLVNETNVFEEHRVKLLHVAPGEPEENLRKEFSQHQNIDYLTADLYADDVMVKIDIMDIQDDDDSFDVVICNHVLEHVANDHKAISEFHRILRPGGWAILQVPISLSLNTTFEDAALTTAEERKRAFGQADHARLYARDYRSRLERAGFFVEEFRWSANSERFGGSANKYGLAEDEVIYRAHKSETPPV